jgi:hypothetical protein
MPSVTGAVEQAASLLKDRISELEKELARLQRALSNLTDGRQGRRGPGRPRGASATTTTRRRRRRGSTRADQAVKIIHDNPGIKVSELGKKMKLNHPNYLYRVLPDLQKEGRVRRKGTGYHPA